MRQSGLSPEREASKSDNVILAQTPTISGASTKSGCLREDGDTGTARPMTPPAAPNEGGLWRVNSEALLIATGQNLKRLLSWRGWGRRPWPSGAPGLRLGRSAQAIRPVCALFWLLWVLVDPSTRRPMSLSA